jgi:NADP-reducing hydrogenase subunit HndB
MEVLYMKSLEELAKIRESMKGKMNIRESDADDIRVLVGMATCGIAAGAKPVLLALTEEVAKRSLKNVQITQTGCIGICQYEPVVEVLEPGKEKVTYVKMTPEKVLRLVNDHLVNGKVVDEYTIGVVAK